MKLFQGLLLLVVASSMVGCASAKKVWQADKVIAMPECSVSISRSTQGTAYSNRFANKGLSTTMVVLTPFGNPAVYQSIADQSCERVKAKIEALGYKVITGDALAAKSEKYNDLQKEYFTKDVDVRDQYAFFGYSKTGVPKGGPGFSVGMGYASMSRNGNSLLVMPTFSVSFGSVAGSGDSVTDANGLTTSTTQAKYSPLVVVRKESYIGWHAVPDFTGRFELSKEISSDSVPWMIDIVKGDTKTDAISAVSSVLFGGRQQNTTYYTMSVDEEKMKEAILKQIDLAENDLVAQIKNFVKE